MEAEIFARRAGGTRGTWMLCGYAGTPLAEGMHAQVFRGREGDAAIMAPVAVPDNSDRRARIAQAAMNNHADLVTEAIWGRQANPAMPVLQFHVRPIAREDRFVMLAGILQDEAGILTAGWRGAEMLHAMTAPGYEGGGALAPLVLQVDPARPDLDWHIGQNLSQVHRQPVWRLGEPEPWAARWTMAPRESEAAIRCAPLRDLVVSGQATPEEEREFDRLNRAAGFVFQGPSDIRDETFERFLRLRVETHGIRGETPALVTAGEAEQESTMVKALLFSLMKKDEDPDPEP